MKKLLLLGLIALFTIVACQQETELVAEDQNLSARGLADFENADGSTPTNNDWVFKTLYVLYEQGTTEAEKSTIRYEYANSGFSVWKLSNWTVCTSNSNVDVWTLRRKADEYPIPTDPLPETGINDDEEDVQEIYNLSNSPITCD